MLFGPLELTTNLFKRSRMEWRSFPEWKSIWVSLTMKNSIFMIVGSIETNCNAEDSFMNFHTLLSSLRFICGTISESQELEDFSCHFPEVWIVALLRLLSTTCAIWSLNPSKTTSTLIRCWLIWEKFSEKKITTQHHQSSCATSCCSLFIWELWIQVRWPWSELKK